ncbi:MAG TPA: extracellular solute-binding protein [Kofleriaceae bacterium]|nr:extracellular solute-binding protein [Kofleriaceae bacterium]
MPRGWPAALQHDERIAAEGGEFELRVVRRQLRRACSPATHRSLSSRGNPAKVGSFEELTKARKLVLGVPEVPIVTYALQILEKAGPDFKNKVLANVASREPNARQVLAKVSQVQSDACIVYRTDALVGKDKVEIIEIPAKVNIVTEYPVAVLTKAPQAAAARAFVDLLLSAEGQKRLATAGFVAP